WGGGEEGITYTHQASHSPSSLPLPPAGSKITGFGHGDFGGSVALCFPELKLSIAILVNDVLTGPQASREILEFILHKFGLEPKWNTPVNLEEILYNITPKQSSS
ncbi:abc1 family protein, partial [Cystoisospora suis]